MEKGRLGAFAIGSSLLNAFLLGVVLTHFIMPAPPPGHPHGEGPPFMRMTEAAASLDQPYRDKVQAILDRNQSAMQANMEKMMATMPEIDAVLTGEKFDPAALKKASTKLESYDREIKSAMLDTMISIANSLPDKQRVEFFRQISPAHHGMHGPPPPM